MGGNNIGKPLVGDELFIVLGVNGRLVSGMAWWMDGFLIRDD